MIEHVLLYFGEKKKEERNQRFPAFRAVSRGQAWHSGSGWHDAPDGAATHGNIRKAQSRKQEDVLSTRWVSLAHISMQLSCPATPPWHATKPQAKIHHLWIA